MISTYIRQEGVEVDRSARTHIRRKLRTKLAKFAASVERVSVRIVDRGWDSGSLRTAEAWRLVVASQASQPYYCTFHPSMRGILVVR